MTTCFLWCRRQPFGKEAFRRGASAMKGFQFEGASDIKELKVLGDWAWMRNRLVVAVTPSDRHAHHAFGLYSHHFAQKAGRSLGHFP
jgi:hypothetical protein